MEEGRYKAKILENDIRSAGTGTPFVYLLLEIEGEQAAANVWLSKNSINMARAQLRACGFDNKTESLTVLKESRTHLAGRIVDVEVAEEEYRGHVQMKVKILTSDVTKKQISEFDRLMKGEEVTETEEDDLPF